MEIELPHWWVVHYAIGRRRDYMILPAETRRGAIAGVRRELGAGVKIERVAPVVF